ncbi:hypothetical protein K438DRAFT_2000575 [Mycena galopus ATCC 62051]|nr:hypothetical protein K438DRAFT_2000575 [Mycena galopus ATCC 62051]
MPIFGCPARHLDTPLASLKPYSLAPFARAVPGDSYASYGSHRSYASGPPLTPTPTAPPPFPFLNLSAYALRAHLLTWFLDAPTALFGVHCMVLAGKAAGKDVVMRFGPRAAGVEVVIEVEASRTLHWTFQRSLCSLLPFSVPALDPLTHFRFPPYFFRYLVHGFPACRLGVSVLTDGTLYQTEIKRIYTFPPSVGIALTGGCPSSSYYLPVGVQLFDLDLHHSRPAVPLRPFVRPSIPHTGMCTPPPHPRRTTHDSRHSLNPALRRRTRVAAPRVPIPDLRAGLVLAYNHGGSMSPDFAHGHGPKHGQSDFSMTSSSSSAPRAALHRLARHGSGCAPSGPPHERRGGGVFRSGDAHVTLSA